MAEKGLIVQNFPSGESIASRDAVENDANSNPRIIQRFDFSSGKGLSVIGTPIRTDVEDNDSLDITAFPANLTSNLITCGDKSLLCVFVEFEDNTDADVEITPIVYDDAGTGVIAVLESKKFEFTTAGSFTRGSTANYLTPITNWDALGAYKIGLHVGAYSETGNSCPINVYGYVI